MNKNSNLSSLEEITGLDDNINIIEDTSSYYDEKENIFFSLPPNNDTFINKTYEEIVDTSELLTIVLANVKNPPSFILTDISFIEHGFHKRLMKYTPKNCNCIMTSIVLICQKETFDIYKCFLIKPKDIENVNQILSNKDYCCSRINIYDVINIKHIVFDKIFDRISDNLLFANSDSSQRYSKRKFNFNNIRECINSDQFIIDRLESLSLDEIEYNGYNTEQTGITNNTYLFDERNSTFFKKCRKIERLDEENTSDFILRKINEKEKRNTLYKNEYNNIKLIFANLYNTSKHGNSKFENISKVLTEQIANRIFKSHKHYIYALRDLKTIRKYANIHPESIWSAIYASYVDECSAIQKVSEHTFRNNTNKTDNFIFTDDDIELLNFIKASYGMKPFIPLKREKSAYFSILPKDFDGVRNGYKINTLKEFRERFDIFTRGLFNNFDWLDEKCLVSGSCITACLAHYNKCGEDIKEFETYIDANYKNSDVDICTTAELLPQLQQNIYELYKKKELNKKKKLINIFKNNKKTTVTLCANITKTVNNLDKLKDFTKVLEKNITSYKCNHCGYKQDSELFMKGETHIILCKQISKLLQNSNRYGAKIYKLSIDPVIDNKNFRPIDVYTNDFGKIGLYHMPIVRAAYSGKKIYMYPSFVCSALSGYCPDYKWFKGRKNPMSIILDKWMKGYNIILNSTEQLQLMSYFIYNYKNEAKKKTPVLARYRNDWEMSFSNPRTIKRICRDIEFYADPIKTTIDESQVKQLIFNYI